MSTRPSFALRAIPPAGAARLGRLRLAHGEVDTPAFMPVGTHGSVKGITPAVLEELGATMILANAYHLAQRPGVETVQDLRKRVDVATPPGVTVIRVTPSYVDAVVPPNR